MKNVNLINQQVAPCAFNSDCKQAGCSACKSFRDVEGNLLKMDSLYGASFTSWLKSEENVMVTATYLQRVCNEYCFPRILTAIRWLEKGWKADSTAWLIKNITQHWGTGNKCPTEKVDVARATFIQCLMEGWTKAKRAEFVPSFLDLSYSSTSPRRLVFLRTLFDKMDFKELSELFSIMGGGLDYSTKVTLLQEAARRESNRLSTKRRQEAASLADESTKKTKCLSDNPKCNQTPSSALLNGSIINQTPTVNIRTSLGSLNDWCSGESTSSINFPDQLEELFENINTPQLTTSQIDDTSSPILLPTLSPPRSRRPSHRGIRLTRVNTDDSRIMSPINPTIQEGTPNQNINMFGNIEHEDSNIDRTSRTCPGSPNLANSSQNLSPFFNTLNDGTSEMDPQSHLTSQDLSSKVRPTLIEQ